MPMHIELFTSGCHLCDRTEEMIKEVMGPKCTLKLYNLAKGEGLKAARKYNIITVPTVVGNGTKMFEGVPDHAELVQCSLEHGCRGHLLKRT